MYAFVSFMNQRNRIYSFLGIRGKAIQVQWLVRYYIFNSLLKHTLLIEKKLRNGEYNIERRITMKIFETERLTLRLQTTDDADFILELVNDPSWLQFIGDRGVRTVEEACEYIENGPNRMYEQFGFCLYLVERKEDQTPLGICGLVKRESLEDVDIGFAFLPKYWGKGYAYEAASATMAYGIDILGLNRIVAITSQDNEASAKLLEKVGLKFERLIQFSDDAEELRLFSYNSF